MKEHVVTIIDSGVGPAAGWKKAGISVAHPAAPVSELIARIERQREIIGDLLVKNEQLRNKLRRTEHNTPSSPAQPSELETAE
jgi:hypothetical protein